MTELVIIRRNADDARPLVEAIRASFPTVVDVTRWDQLRIDRVDSTGQLTAYAAGHALDEVTAVLHLGAPYHGKSAPSFDETYVQQEREQTLLAALVTARQVKLVNRGAVLAWNRGLHEPPAQLRVLAKLGWRVPTITQSYDLTGDAVTRLREPEPEPGTEDLVVIGRRRHARVTGRASTPALDAVIARTQLYLRDHGLDVVSIPIAGPLETPTAYGMHAGFSAEIPREALNHLVREAIAG